MRRFGEPDWTGSFEMSAINELGNTSTTGLKKVRRLPAEISILGVLIGIIIVFGAILYWIAKKLK